jgi:hypothetical protein
MSCLEILQALIPTDLMIEIAEETNRFATQIKAVKPQAMPRWSDVDEADLWRFFGLEILMGLIQKPSIKDYWSTNDLLSTPIFGQIMSRNR